MDTAVERRESGPGRPRKGARLGSTDGRACFADGEDMGVDPTTLGTACVGDRLVALAAAAAAMHLMRAAYEPHDAALPSSRVPRERFGDLNHERP